MKEPVAYWSEHAKNTFKKVADKCFRHGVEQRSSYQFNWDDYTEVQPAPAEEKRECCEPLSGHSKFCPRWNDRRKGERRNPLTPAYGTVREDGRRVRRIWRTFSITWQYDRRTGKDRRKP